MSLLAHTVECVPITTQYSVTWYLKYVVNGKFKISAWVESELEAWEVNWVRIGLSHRLEHYRNQNHKSGRVASLWWLLSLMSWLDYMNNWIPGQHAVLWLCPRPLPLVQNGSGHARLAEGVVTYVLRVEALATEIKKLDRRLFPSEVSDCLICWVQRAKVEPHLLNIYINLLIHQPWDDHSPCALY